MAKYNWGVRKTLIQSQEVKDRLAVLTEIKFIPERVSRLEQYAVLKLKAGKKYMIVKTKSPKYLIQHLNKVLKAYNMGGTSDVLLPLIQHIHKNGYFDLQADVIICSDNAYQVVCTEQRELCKAESDPMCLNNSFEAYIPKYNSKTGMFGWLTKNQFLNFCKYKKRQQTKI